MLPLAVPLLQLRLQRLNDCGVRVTICLFNCRMECLFAGGEEKRVEAEIDNMASASNTALTGVHSDAKLVRQCC
jgi:hypothetical protein